MSSSESDIEEMKFYKYDKYDILPQSEIKILQFENLSKNTPKKKKHDEIDPENNNVKINFFEKFMTIIPEKKVKFENDITIYRISQFIFKKSHVEKQITKKDYYKFINI